MTQNMLHNSRFALTPNKVFSMLNVKWCGSTSDQKMSPLYIQWPTCLARDVQSTSTASFIVSSFLLDFLTVWMFNYAVESLYVDLVSLVSGRWIHMLLILIWTQVRQETDVYYGLRLICFVYPCLRLNQYYYTLSEITMAEVIVNPDTQLLR